MTDAQWMARAISLAAQGVYTTRPNPNVACLIVQGDEIVGEGYHLRAGEPHAEIHALEAAGQSAKGATAYVTLEPCSHTNRTGPCVDALIQAGIRRVVCAMQDPNPKVNGQGVAKLKAAGIEVEVGVCEQEATALNPGFVKAMKEKKPYVRLKMAASLDGKTALANGQSKWITGEQARLDVNRLRAKSAVIITGRGTFEFDQPQMTVRQDEWNERWPHRIEQPQRILCDRNFQTTHPGDFLVAHTQLSRSDEGLFLPQEKFLEHLLDWCYQNQLNDVLVEAGPILAGAFIDQNCVDELWLYFAPTFLGPSARGLLSINDLTHLEDKPQFRLLECQQLGDDVRLIYQK